VHCAALTPRPGQSASPIVSLKAAGHLHMTRTTVRDWKWLRADWKWLRADALWTCLLEARMYEA